MKFYNQRCQRCGQTPSHAIVGDRSYCMECVDIIALGPRATRAEGKFSFVRTIDVSLGIEELEEFVGEEMVTAPPGWRIVYMIGLGAECQEAQVACWMKGESKIWRIPNPGPGRCRNRPKKADWVLMSVGPAIHGITVDDSGLGVPWADFVGYLAPGEDLGVLADELVAHEKMFRDEIMEAEEAVASIKRESN